MLIITDIDIDIDRDVATHESYGIFWRSTNLLLIHIEMKNGDEKMETLNQFSFARIYTLGRIKQVKDSAWDIQPPGFNNTILWNVGHIYVNAEILAQKEIPSYEIVHPEWLPLFVPGTKPSDWNVEPPKSGELVSALKEQTERIKGVLDNNLSNVLIESMSIGNLHEMNTVEALVQFMVWHEGVHAGIIHALNRATCE